MHWIYQTECSYCRVAEWPAREAVMVRVGRARVLVALALIASCVHLPGREARAGVVSDWNVIALNATAVPPNSVLQSRTLAIVHAAIYDAVRAVDRKAPAYAVDLKAPQGADVDAAVAAAAHGVLVRLAPVQRPVLDGALDAALAKIAQGDGKAEGINIGA